MITPLPPMLIELATTFAELFRQKDLNERLAHHLAHVAPETWLSMELAYLVNRQTISSLVGWHALLEQQRVDVTLYPQGNEVADQLPLPIRLELKLIDRYYWNSNWVEIERDLMGKGVKPRADYALGFLLQPNSPTYTKPLSKTLQQWETFFASIPTTPGIFIPVAGLPPFQLAWSSDPIRLTWPRTVQGKWPEGYQADLRILWMSPPSS